MRAVPIVLEMIAVALVLTVAGIQFQATDFALAEREKQEDLRLRDYVISYDLEYVKTELIALQKDRWVLHAEGARRAKTSWILLTLAAVASALAYGLRWRKRTFERKET